MDLQIVWNVVLSGALGFLVAYVLSDLAFPIAMAIVLAAVIASHLLWFGYRRLRRDDTTGSGRQ